MSRPPFRRSSARRNTGSVIETPVTGPVRRVLPPYAPAAVDFGMGP